MIAPVANLPAAPETAVEPRVSISLRTNIAEACDLESTRYALGSFQVYPTNAKGETYIAATDSRILAIAPVDGHCTERTLIATLPKPAELKKPHRILADDSGSKLLTGPRGSNPETLADRPDVSVRQSPSVKATFPRVADVLPDDFGGKRFAVVTLNAELLLSLARAISTGERGGVVDMILPLEDGKPGELGATVCDAVCVSGNAGFGLIMPHAREAQDWKDAADARRRFADAAAAFRSVANAAK